MSPAIAAARKAGPPIAAGSVSGETSGLFVAALAEFGGGRGAAAIAAVAGAGSDPVESAFVTPDCGAAGVALADGAALGGETASGCAAGSAGAGRSKFRAAPDLPGAASGAAAATGAASGIGSFGAGAGGFDATVAGLPAGCSAPLRGCAVLLSGCVTGSAGFCHGLTASPAGRLS
jgi:hypothetical protein